MGKVKEIIHKIKRLLIRCVEMFIKPCIIFESRPPFSDNTRPVYDEFVRRGYDKKYRLVWYLDDNTCASLKDGKPIYWDPMVRHTISDKIRNMSLNSKTKAIICCNRYLGSSGYSKPVDNKDLCSFYLSHGIPIKSIKSYYSAPDSIDYALSASEAVTQIMVNEFGVSEDRYFALGYPRNDVFSKQPINLKERIGGGFEKIIIWYPTFRQHFNQKIVSSGSSIPIIHDAAAAQKLNEVARENNILILLKPHFVQDRSMLHKTQLSNIRFIDDQFFEEMGFTSYEMLAASDALLTDYSSVYFDYTLHDKPIGVIWEDIEDYKEFPGFAVDLEYYLKGAEKIYNIDELCSFVRSVAQGEDPLQKERREIRDLVNYSTDGKNAARVVDFIIEKARL